MSRWPLPLPLPLLFLPSLVALAPCHALGIVKAPGGFQTRGSGTSLAVRAVGEGILQVVVAPGGTPPVPPGSWSVRIPRRGPRFRLDRERGACELRAPGIRARFEAAQGRLRFMNARGQLLFEAGAHGFEGSHIQATFHLQPDEPLYGLGQQEDGILDRRNQKVRLLQSNKRVAIPFLAAPGSGHGAWGVLWDNASHTEFEDGPDGTRLWSDHGKAVVYYVIAAPDLDGVLGGLRTLTGQVPLLPKWAYGFWQSRERYESQAELVKVAEEYRRRRLPLDGIIQDWRYWGRHGWNAMKFDEAAFPQPGQMVADLHRLNTKLLISVWPNFETRTGVAKEMAEAGLLAASTGRTDDGAELGVYDAFSERGRRIYWRHLKEAFLEKGVDGLWMDATEPEFNSWSDDSLRQKDYVRNLPEHAGGPWLNDLNAYPLVDVEGVVRNWNATFPDQRPVILTRSAFLGMGRTGAILWSGDIPSSFQSLRRQIANGLNASMSGIPYWNTDIGGFFPAWFGGEYPKGVRDPAYRELFVRWFQTGAFHPMFRAHGSTTPREIWQFGEPGSQEYEALSRMLKLRYRLLPYLYATGAGLRSREGAFLRPLGMEDPACAKVQDQFLCGRSLLVSPILEHQKVPGARQGRILDPDLALGPEGEAGMRISFFEGENLTGPPRKVATAPRAEFNWNLQPPIGHPGEAFSLRLEGRLKAQESPQSLTLGCMGGMRAWVDGRLVVDDWERAPFRLKQVTVDLRREAALRIECRGGDSTHLVAGLEDAAQARTPAKGRSLLLPRGAWVDFWTGVPLEGGRRIWKEADLDTLPLHVRAGSILPLGPERQHAMEVPEDPLEVRVYPGSDGRLDLYEDDGRSRAYERGERSLIPFRWDDRKGILHIGARKGGFKGMLRHRTFRIVRVGPGHGGGENETPQADRVVSYRGRKLNLKL